MGLCKKCGKEEYPQIKIDTGMHCLTCVHSLFGELRSENAKMLKQLKQLKDGILTHQVRTISPDENFYIKDDELWSLPLKKAEVK